MTTQQFDAPAAITRGVRASERGSRIIRLSWLLGRFIRRDSVLYDAYRNRFGGSAHAFESDLAALRRAYIYRGSEWLGRWKTSPPSSRLRTSSDTGSNGLGCRQVSMSALSVKHSSRMKRLADPTASSHYCCWLWYADGKGGLANDLQEAADHAEILLALKLRKHLETALEIAHDQLSEHWPLWS
jgi:hypothetical protein